MNATTERPIDRWFAHYSADHQHTANQAIHVFAVPLILWSVIGLLWCIPQPGTWFRPGLWAALSMFAAWMFYYRASRAIGFGMLAIFVAMAWLTRWLHDLLGTPGLFKLALGGFLRVNRMRFRRAAAFCLPAPWPHRRRTTGVLRAG